VVVRVAADVEVDSAARADRAVTAGKAKARAGPAHSSATDGLPARSMAWHL
jgi:hypothetical protein